MDSKRLVLIIESDANARTQMLRVLSEFDATVVEASTPDDVYTVASELHRDGRHPDLIVARVTLPEGNGVQVLKELAGLFPGARKVLVSHYAKSLLFSLPGFATCHAEFIKAEFTDEHFRQFVERALAKRLTA